MSDTIKGFTITLKKDVGEDYAKKLKKAFLLFDGVISVEEHIADFDHHIAKIQIKTELGEKLWDVLYPKKE